MSAVSNTLNSLIEAKSNYFQGLPAKTNTEISCYILGKSNPYYKYFLANEEEKKENLILLYEGIYKKRSIAATASFLIYNVAKSILWRRGYFAYFFYHTRNMSFIVFALTVYLFKRNFDAHLMQDNLLRYYEKRKAFKDTKVKIDSILAKENRLKELNSDQYEL